MAEQKPTTVLATDNAVASGPAPTPVEAKPTNVAPVRAAGPTPIQVNATAAPKSLSVEDLSAKSWSARLRPVRRWAGIATVPL